MTAGAASVLGVCCVNCSVGKASHLRTFSLSARVPSPADESASAVRRSSVDLKVASTSANSSLDSQHIAVFARQMMALLITCSASACRIAACERCAMTTERSLRTLFPPPPLPLL